MMMQTRQNRRGYTEYFVTGHHLNLTDLKTEGKNFKLRSNYLYEDIPNYPKPEFHVSRLKHETGELGLRGIRGDGGFRTPDGESKIWWSLAVGPDEINNAEMRLPENRFPDRRSVAPEQQRFLWKFATSPAFKETSRLGSFRFTFPLQEVLTAYRDQICSGDDPVMRVYETVLYKQEVMYTVLVHSPDLNKKFSNYPLLTDDPNSICVYKDGCFIWRSEAMCETHWYEFDDDKMEAVENHRPRKFNVWDHVALALHVENDQVLTFDFNKPEDFLTYCENDDVAYVEGFQDHDKANELVKELWPEWLGALKVERPLQMHYPVTELKLVLTGRCGEETSSTGSTLSGNQAFHFPGLGSVDMEVDNLEVKIINTPKFSELTTKEEIKETLNYIRCSGPALHVFLLVISLKNITANLIRTVERFELIFQNKALRRTMILFTHQAQTELDIQEMMQEVQQFLTEKVGNRYLVFNNRLEDRDPQRVSDLLRQVKKILGGE